MPPGGEKSIEALRGTRRTCPSLSGENVGENVGECGWWAENAARLTSAPPLLHLLQQVTTGLLRGLGWYRPPMQGAGLKRGLCSESPQAARPGQWLSEASSSQSWGVGGGTAGFWVTPVLHTCLAENAQFGGRHVKKDAGIGGRLGVKEGTASHGSVWRLEGTDGECICLSGFLGQR